MSKFGRQLSPDSESLVAMDVREVIKDHEPVGKLLQWIRQEEVAEFNGKDGKPLYVTLKHQVYDITCE
jgi:hypothetical protein